MKLNDKLETTLKFTHCRTQGPAKLTVARNPLTGNWLQDHFVEGEGQTAYYSDKRDAQRLVNAIIAKSQKLGLPCEVTTTKNRMP